MVGRVKNRDDHRFDWIVSDGPLLNTTEYKLLLESPFFGRQNFRGAFEGEWKMTLRLTLEGNKQTPSGFGQTVQSGNTPSDSIREDVELCVAGDDCVGMGGYGVEAGFLSHDGKEIPLFERGRTDELGVCFLRTAFYDVPRIFPLLHYNGRLVIYCKITDPE